MQELGLIKLIEGLCKCASENKTPLKITKEEAKEILSGLINEKTLMERIRSVEINRKPYKMNEMMRFQKYFETMGHNGIIERICFDNSSKYAFTGGSDGVVKCWSIPDGMLIRSLYGHDNMVSDLCINKTGDLLVSVDYQGILNIWCLNEFKLLNSVNLNTEAIFCEFIYKESHQDDNDHRIFIILSDGTVRTIRFSKEEIIEHKNNRFMEGESIKSICITDGGRFVICGGWWPFFLIYDTQDLDNVIVFEDFKIQTLCAAKNSLKFAAASENQIFSYTFYCEGSASNGNFNRKKVGDGYWKKYTSLIDGDYFVEWLCFLPSFLLVAACTDNIIRIYEDDQLVLSFQGEVGTIYSHPTENIFAVVGTKLSVYQIVTPEMKQTRFTTKNDRCDVSNASVDSLFIDLVYSENIYINLNDCQFSDNGKYFITCDDQGVIKTYSTDFPISVPEQQFFISDLDRTVGTGSFEDTFNFYRQKNSQWKKIKYETTSNIDKNKSIYIENYAISSLERLKINENKFKRLYLSSNSDENPDQPVISRTRSDEEETYIISSNSDENRKSPVVPNEGSITKRKKKSPSSHSESNSSEKSKKRKLEKLKGYKNKKTRRLVISDTESDSSKRKIIESENESELLVSPKTTRKLVESDDSLIKMRPRRILRRSLGLIPDNIDEFGSEIQTTKSTDTENLSNRSVESSEIQQKSSRVVLRRSLHSEMSTSFVESSEEDYGIDLEFERVLSRFSYNWLSSCSIYEGVVVYFDLSSYKELMLLEQRINFSKKQPKKSGIYSVTSMKYNFIGRIPYLSLELSNKFEIQFYEYPDSKGIVCTLDQYKCNNKTDILYFEDDGLRSGKIKKEDDKMMISVNGRKMLRSMILIKGKHLKIQPIDYVNILKPLFGLSRIKKFKTKPIIDYNLINIKLKNDLYRNENELLFDLKYISKIAYKLEDTVKNLAADIYTKYSNMFC